MKNTFSSCLHRRCFTITLIFLSGILSASDEQYPSLPDWQILEFEHRAFFSTATSSLELTLAPDNGGHWVFHVSNSIDDNNSEEIFLEFDPVNGRSIRRTRLSSGKDRRFKLFDYGEKGIRRERRDPGQDITTIPSEWGITSTKDIAYPPSIEHEVVTDVYALIAMANQLIYQPGESVEAIVHGESDFYRVEMTSSPWIPLIVDYEIDGVGMVRGKRATITVRLKISPVGEPLEEDDFSLLGLHGYIVLFFDKETGALIRLLGDAPLIGRTEINLKKVYPRYPQ